MIRQVRVEHELHSYTVLEFPFVEAVLDMLLEIGTLTITHDGIAILASAHKQGWVMAARRLCQSRHFDMRQLGTVIISTFPELFRELSRELGHDGTLVCT